jgi:hypothetical protein
MSSIGPATSFNDAGLRGGVLSNPSGEIESSAASFAELWGRKSVLALVHE